MNDGIAFGHGGKGTLQEDGRAVFEKKIPKAMRFVFPEDGTFNLGVDARPPIDYRG